jgi:hypothetical protein
MPELEMRAELPVACTLGPGDGAERMRRWQRLGVAGSPVSRMESGRLVVRYQPGPGIAEELRALAQAEAGCCSFAEWAVSEPAGQPTLVVSAPAGLTDAAAAERVAPVAALFGAG